MLPFAYPHALLDLLLARAESTEPAAASCLSPAEERGDVGLQVLWLEERSCHLRQVGPGRGRTGLLHWETEEAKGT